MVQVLLTSEEFVKSLCNIDQNLAGQYLQSALIEVQEIELKEILGQSLLDTLKGKVYDKSIAGPYQELLEKCQYVIAYKAIANLCVMATFKIANVGTVVTSDDGVHNLSWSDLVRVKEYYTHRADSFVNQLQRYLLSNRSNFPELKDCDCDNIKAHPYTSATCGLWLGGVRARKLVPYGKY